jgi:hypothetical protein
LLDMRLDIVLPHDACGLSIAPFRLSAWLSSISACE